MEGESCSKKESSSEISSNKGLWELLPGAKNVGSSVEGFLAFWALLETNLSGSGKVRNIYCEVSSLVWGLLKARILKITNTTQYFLLTKQPEEIMWKTREK